MIVIDPKELKLYGYDPATTLQIFKLYQNSGLLSATSKGGWPGMYILIDVLNEILSIPLMKIGKYLPLISILIPIIFFLGVKRIGGSKVALYAVLSVIYLKTYRGFEAKLVDEIPAMIALYFILYIFMFKFRARSSNKRVIVLSAVFFSLAIISHPILAIASVILILINEILVENLLYRIDITDEQKSISILQIATAAAIAVTVLIFWGINSNTVAGIIVGLTQLGGSPSWTVGGKSIPSIRQMVVYYGTMSLIVIWSIATLLSVVNKRTKTKNWQLSLSFFAGVTTILYFFQLFAGRVIAYDPARYLLLFIPITTFIMLHELEHIDAFPKDIIQIVLLISFITIHSFAISPQVLISNPDETTLGEGNYTPQQYQSTYWVEEYSSEKYTVVGYEIELWRYIGRQPELRPSSCEPNKIFVERLDQMAKDNSYINGDKIYTSHGVKLYRCSVL
ncbi:hypothetical protein [Haladaptatus caseinilyticus]|uniref:hypothetical protein n=1 Tax=Haladaptatus caseinilyticus TaxID=2993314 RepID=UPI00224B1A09|nr:hypothetical protein [Haladaptatus caseinilyticus]